jgi:hypothetical protein
VDSAQTDLNKASESQKTAQAAMLAARAAVKADAAGAAVHFSDAPKTNQITDSSARYIAEATRTIVSTTLIASFAQEECTNVWNLIDELPAKDKLAVFALDGAAKTGKSGGAKADDYAPEAEEQLSAAGEIVQLAKNCQHNENLLLTQTALLTPQYGAAPAGPLQVLGTQGGITMTPSDEPHQFIIVGGIPPYRASDLAPQFKGELEASIPKTPVNGSYSLLIQRPKGASKKDKTDVFVVDANNAYVQIPVTLEAAAAPKPTVDANAPTNVKAAAAAGGKISVTFTLPKSTTITKLTANAVDKTDLKGAKLTQEGKITDTSIDLAGCVDKHNYAASVTAEDSSGTHTANAAKPVTCTAGATPSPANGDKPKSPAPPTNVTANTGAGAKITVSFAASTDATVTGYSATAMNAKGGGTPLKGDTPDKNVVPIVLTGCADGTSYVVTVTANIKATASEPAKASAPVTCTK